MQAPPEQLGSFFLGAEYNLKTGQRLDDKLVNYDARDLTTHAICVGMTGSGKTGLCLGLLEEAAIDRVPAIIIDPKGDITNLLLQFPDMRPEDFEPWINPDDARRQGQTISQYAEATAQKWQTRLADWGIHPDRLKLLPESADFAIYTPGSDAGIPVNLLGNLTTPDVDFNQNRDSVRERISGTVAALLGLIGRNADPIRSQEAILLSNIFEQFWSQNKSLDLAQLITAIQHPPMRQVGVVDVDSFYPEKERFELAMAFNNLVASPSFHSWLEGEPLDIEALLYTPTGRPRHAIFYIAHLTDSERMFFVTLLLENLLTWVRRQAGTTSLRALLYFDEVFGFLPPVAQPPSKRPILTLLKQARAFGLGCVLVTQNPVDLDYKSLTNAGTWFIGKLQAERDKDRVLEGLEGAIAEVGGIRKKIDYGALINQLSRRVFLMHNVHQDRPLIFQTRWVMSYLRGPLTRPQVRQLMVNYRPRLGPGSDQTQAQALSPATATLGPPSVELGGFSDHAPVLDPQVTQLYLPVQQSKQVILRQFSQEERQRLEATNSRLVYKPAILGVVEVRFVDRKRNINQKREQILLAPVPGDVTQVDWAGAGLLPIELNQLADRPQILDTEQRPLFAPPPEAANTARKLKSIGKDLADWLYYNSRYTITVHPEFGIFQHPEETSRAFRIRLQQTAREKRDAEIDELEQKYEDQIERLEDKLRKRERELVADEDEYEARRRQEMIGMGESVLAFFFGRRRTRSFSVAANRRRMTSQAKLDLEETKEEIEDLQQEIEDLEAELEQRTAEITRKWVQALDDLKIEEITPRRTDVNVRLTALAWAPSWLIAHQDGSKTGTATVAAYSLSSETPLPGG